MRVELRQADKPHDTNQLHEELISAGLLTPDSLVESSSTKSAFVFPDGTSPAAVQSVITAHAPRPNVAAPTLADLNQAIFAVDFDTPTTLAGIKLALNQLKKRVARYNYVRDLKRPKDPADVNGAG